MMPASLCEMHIHLRHCLTIVLTEEMDLDTLNLAILSCNLHCNTRNQIWKDIVFLILSKQSILFIEAKQLLRKT